ncbi:dihydropyrimidinase [Brevibacillus borstelensis]|jgi:dihydropyrimidinase|uniref:dihydropyrimidinase n=1 Tax=Brevibacillus borstelensis TaxID=45462 RepID=UPI001D09BDF1|nr:dihydropyrimidinase [Brevibacillus borstelensis]MCC0563764.1 dihydropyrimidinase [Brevibacillus borstelensis]MCM3469537.1 dihydropyrimidinase [Brevibacillus borstelensis]MCM3559232.1 dihydropyrimidinase [Brevibacillus borstelensis]MCM3589331.1 dihydropyrimidinase [Brevibacillus borstelensis]MED2006767.1 dihydropyrimidinase [Brevibacillus borstelensis]
MKKWIRGGTVVTAADTYQADVLIEGERVVAIGHQLSVDGAEEIDATGCYVIPGGIDPHTHLDMPFGGTVTADDFFTGTRAAAFGGTTSIVDFCLTKKGESLKSAIATWHEKARGKAVIDYGFHLMIAEANDQVLEELESVISSEGITSLKVFMAYKNVFQADDETLFKTLVKAKELGALVQVHAENGDVLDYLTKKALAEGNTDPIYHAYTRPPEAEGEATGRAIALTALAGSQLYVVHVSCASAVQRIAEAREKGWNVYGETCPQYLALDVSIMDQPDFEGAKYVWSPPLREKWNQEVLWSALKNGILQTVGSDHCPFNFRGQKELGRGDFTKIPNGGPLIEDRLTILYSEGVRQGRISLNQFVDISSTKAAKLFGMFPRKGTIAVGSDADIVIFDPHVKRTLSVETHHMNVDYNPFEGMEVYGEVVSVLSRGSFVVRDKQFVGQAGSGQYIKRTTFEQP